MTALQGNRIRASQAADALLKQFDVSSLPVDVEWIASQLGITIETEQLPLNIFGATAHDGIRTRILVAASCPTEGHRRFTIAHEIGHCCIEGHAAALFGIDRPVHQSEGSVGSRRDPIEIEADAFAAALLMPDALVAEIAGRHQPSFAMISAVADAAQTSLSAAAIRLTELVPDPFIVVLSKKGEIEWASFSGGVSGHQWTKRLQKGGVVPVDSPTMILAKKPARIAASESECGDTNLSEWFIGAPSVYVGEEAVGLGSYGRIMTVLPTPAIPSLDQAEHQRRMSDTPPKDWRDAMRTFAWDDPNSPDD